MLFATGLSRADTVIAGAGGETCEAWTKARKVQNRQPKDAVADSMMISWVQGFLSSKNSNGATILDVPDVSVLRFYTDKVCGRTPEAKIFSIADDLADLLIEQYSEKKRK